VKLLDVPALIRIGDQIAIMSLATRKGSFAAADPHCEHDKTGGRSPPCLLVFVAAVRPDGEDDLVPEVGQIGSVRVSQWQAPQRQPAALAKDGVAGLSCFARNGGTPGEESSASTVAASLPSEAPC
jgi:hypothetical protein